MLVKCGETVSEQIEKMCDNCLLLKSHYKKQEDDLLMEDVLPGHGSHSTIWEHLHCEHTLTELDGWLSPGDY